MGGKKGRKLRHWSDEEKRSICLQTTTPGVSIAQVARRYAMNANLIHKWLKDARLVPVVEGVCDVEDPVDGFLPVEIDGHALSDPLVSVRTCQSFEPALSATRVDLTLSDGRRVLVESPTALSAVLGLDGVDTKASQCAR
jgi:transposase